MLSPGREGPTAFHVRDGTLAVRSLVLESAERRTPLRIAGRSHWMDAGRPVAAERIASLAGDSGIVDYVPGDLTITARAGTTLDEIEKATAGEGQWLPLCPHGSADGSIGATIATGSFGPLAQGFGRARDLVLGLEFVTGDGRVVRGGGRVVKNVAGFDLVRLVTGSWGTLGVITEVTLRLYALPQERVTLAIEVPDRGAGLRGLLAALWSSPVTPFAVELVDDPLSRVLGLDRSCILVELGGNSASVAAQRDAVGRLGPVAEVASEIWGRLRTAEDAGHGERAGESSLAAPIVVRISAPPAGIEGLWTAVGRIVAEIDGAYAHATPGLGVMRCVFPAGTGRAPIAQLASIQSGVTVLYERLPSDMWAGFSPSVTSDALSQRVRNAFDPHGLLNPGILGPVS